jgi:hypothetical protein
MQLVLVHEPLEREACLIEAILRREARAAAMNPAAVRTKRQLRCQQARERPGDRLVEHIETAPAIWRVLPVGRQNQELVRNRRIVERHGAGKEPVAGNSVRVRGLNQRTDRKRHAQAMCELRRSHSPPHWWIIWLMQDRVG